MTSYLFPTPRSLERALCVYVSIGFDYAELHDAHTLARRGQRWIPHAAKEAAQAVLQHEEHEIILSVYGSNRCRLYVYPQQSLLKKDLFPEHTYLLGVTHMNHFSQPKEQVLARFDRIQQTLLGEGFPVILL